MRYRFALVAALRGGLLHGCSPISTVHEHPLPPDYASKWAAKNATMFQPAGTWGPGPQCFKLKGPICAGATYNPQWHQSIIQVENVTHATPSDAEDAWDRQRPGHDPKTMQINKELDWEKPWIIPAVTQGEALGFDCRETDCRGWVWVAHKDRNVRGLMIQVVCSERPCEENRISLAEFLNLVSPIQFGG